MPLVVGQTLSSYEILGSLGTGAMGEVYRARDSRLQRDVAIKVLPDEFAADAERLQRFEREARALAALNHPNVAQIHGIDEVDGTRFLVLELVPGETLEDRLQRGPMSMSEARAVCRQIAAGLEAAHDAGVVHRDLKPANVRLTPDDKAKVLDFGLAKQAWQSESGASDSVLSTTEGQLIGTPTYMAPEQARGRAIDRRVDVWAFGCLLFECLAGKRAFIGRFVDEVLVAVLEREPDWGALPSATPEWLRALLHRCLDKDPRTRLRDVGEARILLERGPADARAPIGLRMGSLAFAIVVLVVALVGVVIGRFWPSAPDGPGVARQERLTDLAGMEESPAVSPDGQRVAFISWVAGRRQVFVRLLEAGTWVRITTRDADHSFPRWVDNNRLVYLVHGEDGAAGSLYETDYLASSPPKRILESVEGEADIDPTSSRLATFRADDLTAELVIINLADGSEKQLPLVPAWYGSPRWSPDGTKVAFEAKTSLAVTEIRVVDADGGETETVVRANQTRGLAWLPDGSGLVYASSKGSTMAYPPVFSLRYVAIDGSGDRLLAGDGAGYSSLVEPDVTHDHKIIASRIAMHSDVWRYPIDGTPQQNVENAKRITFQTGHVQVPSVSPDGTQVCYLSDSSGHANVWVSPVEEWAPPRQITFEQDPRTIIGIPVWSPNGDWIVYYRGPLDADTAEEWVVTPEGTRHTEIVKARGAAVWSHDGEWLYHLEPRSGWEGNRVIATAKIRVSSEGKPVGEPVRVRDACGGLQISPDGETGYFFPSDGRHHEIWYASPIDGEAKQLYVADRTRVPMWPHQYALSPDGKRLAAPFRDHGTTNLWLISTEDRSEKPITDFGTRATTIGRQVSWSSDGKYIFAALMESDADIVLIDGAL